MMRLQQIGDREVRGQRHRRVARLRIQPRPETEREATIGASRDLLFRRIDPRGAAPGFGRRDPAREFGEVGRQVGVADTVISEFRAAADARAFHRVDLRRAVGGDADGEHDRGALAIGQQACCALAQYAGVKPGLAVGEI